MEGCLIYIGTASTLYCRRAIFFLFSMNHSAVACIHVALPGMKRGGRGLLLFGDRSSIVVGGLR